MVAVGVPKAQIDRYRTAKFHPQIDRIVDPPHQLCRPRKRICLRTAELDDQQLRPGRHTHPCASRYPRHCGTMPRHVKNRHQPLAAPAPQSQCLIDHLSCIKYALTITRRRYPALFHIGLLCLIPYRQNARLSIRTAKFRQEVIDPAVKHSDDHFFTCEIWLLLCHLCNTGLRFLQIIHKNPHATSVC